MSENKRIALLQGGDSEERDISLVSGEQVFAALNRLYGEVKSFDPIDDGWLAALLRYQPDCVFIILHGGAGENGEIQKLLERNGLTYTGSDSVSSSRCMNKIQAKAHLSAYENFLVPSVIWQKESKPKLSYPLFIKPNASGSSCGTSRVDREDQFVSACEQAAKYGDVLIESCVEGVDVCVPIIGDRALCPIAIRPQAEFYDYEAKYLSDHTVYELGAGLTLDEICKIKSLSLDIFKDLGCSGWGRLDFIRRANGSFVFLEMNTVPGMTSHSLVPKSARQEGISFDALIKMIIDEAIASR